MTADVGDGSNERSRLRKLMRLAWKHTRDGGRARCLQFYRNKSPEYFTNILRRNNGLMETKLKDKGGDPASPINGELSGLFFTASVDRHSTTGKPIPVSPFGTCRLFVPVKNLLDKAPNIYFTDFYCMRTSHYHYVTLVMTTPDSNADQFCAKFLYKLDINQNPFLVMHKSGQLHVSTKELLIVEIFYTENLDIKKYELKHNIPVHGKGSSTMGGIMKKRHCTICNIQQ